MNKSDEEILADCLRDEEVLRLHRELAGERLRADEMTRRLDSKNRELAAALQERAALFDELEKLRSQVLGARSSICGHFNSTT